MIWSWQSSNHSYLLGVRRIVHVHIDVLLHVLRPNSRSPSGHARATVIGSACCSSGLTVLFCPPRSLKTLQMLSASNDVMNHYHFCRRRLKRSYGIMSKIAVCWPSTLDLIYCVHFVVWGLFVAFHKLHVVGNALQMSNWCQQGYNDGFRERTSCDMYIFAFNLRSNVYRVSTQQPFKFGLIFDFQTRQIFRWLELEVFANGFRVTELDILSSISYSLID